jgi:general secretion pathway protein D
MTAALLAALALLPSAVSPAPIGPAQGAEAPKPQEPGAQPAVGADGKIPRIQDHGQFLTLYFEEQTEGEAGLSLEAFVKLCQDATGINFTYTEQTAQTLKDKKLKMFGPKTIPKSDFYSFFQIMMIINDFVCTKIGPDHLAVVLIQSSQANQRQGGGTLKKDAVYVAPDDLDQYADQPAVLIHTVVDLPHVDARQLSTSLRQMFPDQQTQSILPVSNTSLILTGFGSDVAAMVRMLQFVDEAAGKVSVILPEFEMIPLEFASAEEVADTLTDLLDASRRASQARGAQVAQQQGATGQMQSGQTESKIMVDARTNSLLVMAMPEDMPRIKELIARLDVDIVQGERTYHIYNLENVDAEELSDTLDGFIRDASRVAPGGAGGRAQGQPQAGGTSSTQRNEVVVVADKATNSLLIAANRTRYEEVLDLIRRLDQRQDQVLIETALIELTGQDSFRLAVELGLAEISGSGDGGFGVSSFGLSTFEDTNGDGVPDIRLPNLFGGSAPDGITAGIIQGDDFSLPVLLNALKTRRDTNVLNVPSVLVNNNKSAKVVSKDEQPTTTITATGGLNGQTQENFKEYVEAGITLEISPTISASRYLRLNISLEVSTFIGAVNGAIPPPKVTRTINTQVNVPDGDTMVVGGIVTDNLGTSQSSVPWLGDIPILGYLFSDNSESQSKTTLYFFVTPHIMRDRDFADLAEYSFRRKLDAADTIGADRIRVVDPTFGREQEGVDMRGFEVPLYRGPQRGEVRDEDVGLDARKLNELLEQGRAEAAEEQP